MEQLVPTIILLILFVYTPTPPTLVESTHYTRGAHQKLEHSPLLAKISQLSPRPTKKKEIKKQRYGNKNATKIFFEYIISIASNLILLVNNYYNANLHFYFYSITTKQMVVHCIHRNYYTLKGLKPKYQISPTKVISNFHTDLTFQ